MKLSFAQWEECYLSKYLHLLKHWETPQPVAACWAFMPRYHFCFCISAHHGIVREGTYYRQRERTSGPSLCALYCCRGCWECRHWPTDAPGYSSAESNQQCFCRLQGSACSPGFISMTPFLFWLHEKQHSDLFCLVRSFVHMHTQKILFSQCFAWFVSATVMSL